MLQALLTILLTIASVSARADARVNGQFVAEEEGLSLGVYIPPNEIFSYVYGPLLAKKTGALLSIGTFRALDRSAQGNFSTVIQLDYDQRATQFNRLNLELLRASRDRFEYIARLLGKTPAKSLLEQARAGKISMDAYFDALKKQKLNVMPASPTEIQMAELLALPRTPDATPEQTILADLERGMWKFFGVKEAAAASLFGSDEVFAKVRARAESDNIIPINGDIGGDATLKDLARVLKASSTEVTVVDLSNVIGHKFFYDTRSLKPTKKMLRNLRALPLADDALFLFTDHIEIGEGQIDTTHKQTDRWAYFALSRKEFFNAVDLGYLDTEQAYRDLVKQAIEHRLEQDWKNEGLIVPGPMFQLTEPVNFASSFCRSRTQRILTDARFKVASYLERKLFQALNGKK